MALRYIVKKIFPSAVPIFHSPSNVGKVENLVFISGWGGSERKNFRKQIDYYNSMGYGVVTHVMPLA